MEKIDNLNMSKEKNIKKIIVRQKSNKIRINKIVIVILIVILRFNSACYLAVHY